MLMHSSFIPKKPPLYCAHHHHYVLNSECTYTHDLNVFTYEHKVTTKIIKNYLISEYKNKRSQLVDGLMNVMVGRNINSCKAHKF